MYENFTFLVTELGDDNELVDIYVDDEAGQLAICPIGGYPQDADSVIYGGETAAEIRARLFDY